MSPQVLVLVPSYNHGRFISKRLQTVLDQTYTSLQLLVIDDGSSDNTAAELSKFHDTRLRVMRRSFNSGSPFTAWIEARDELIKAHYDYIWIAESDDFAETTFLERGLRELQNTPSAALYYCHSWMIDEEDLIIGHSINYLRQNFPQIQWQHNWHMEGPRFASQLLLNGMAIPNMSSALIRADAFSAAVEPSLCNFKLAGDWAFSMRLATQGSVIFDSWDGNSFRQHARTSRRETETPRALLEYMVATYYAYIYAGAPKGNVAKQLAVWSRICKENHIQLASLSSICDPHLRPYLDDILACLPVDAPSRR